MNEPIEFATWKGRELSSVRKTLHWAYNLPNFNFGLVPSCIKWERKGQERGSKRVGEEKKGRGRKSGILQTGMLATLPLLWMDQIQQMKSCVQLIAQLWTANWVHCKLSQLCVVDDWLISDIWTQGTVYLTLTVIPCIALMYSQLVGKSSWDVRS